MTKSFFTKARWLVTIILLILFAVPHAWADYTIGFATSGSTVIASGGDYVSDATRGGNTYIETNGLRFGKSGGTGSITVTLTSSGTYIGQIKASKITIKDVLRYGSDTSVGVKTTVTYTDDSTTEDTYTAPTSATDHDITLTSTKTIKSVKIESTTNSKRFYCKGFTVVAAAASHTLSSAVAPAASGSVELSATSVMEGSTATATATPATHYTFTSWSISGTGASLSSTTTNPTTVTMGTANATITATFTAVPKASITLSEAGATTTDATTYYVGDTYTLPTSTSASCGTKELVGWSTVEVAETNTKPSSNYYEKGADVTLAASQTFYAVFATASGSGSSNATKVFSGENTADYQFTTGSDSEAGSIVNAEGYTAGKVNLKFSKGSASNWPYYDGTVVRMYKNSTFSITPSSATITRVEVVRSSSSSSNGGTLSVSGLTASGDNTTTNTNVFTGSATSEVTFSNDAQCRFSSISITYSYSTTTYSAYATSCCTALGQINGSFFVTHFFITSQHFCCRSVGRL